MWHRIRHLSFSLSTPFPDPPQPTDFVCETHDLISAVCRWNEGRATHLYGTRRKTHYSVNKRYTFTLITKVINLRVNSLNLCGNISTGFYRGSSDKRMIAWAVTVLCHLVFEVMALNYLFSSLCLSLKRVFCTGKRVEDKNCKALSQSNSSLLSVCSDSWLAVLQSFYRNGLKAGQDVPVLSVIA